MRIFLILATFCLGLTARGYTQQNQNQTQDTIIEIAKDLIDKLERAGGTEIAAAQQKNLKSFKAGELELNDFIIKLSKGSSNLFFYHSDFYGSESLLLKLLSVAEADTSISKGISAEINRSMSAILIDKGDIRKALIFSDRAEQQYRDALVDIPHMFYISTGNIYLSLNLTAKAREYFEESLRALQRMENPEGFRFLVSYYSIANSLVIDKRYDEALDYLNRILVMGVPMMGENDPNLAQTYELMSLIYINKRQFKKGEHYLEKTKNIYLNSYGEIHNRTANLFSYFAAFYVAQEDHDKAHSFYLRRAAIEKELYGEKNGAVAHTFYLMGRNFIEQKKYKLAETYFKKSLTAITFEHANGGLSTVNTDMYLASSHELASTHLSMFKQGYSTKDLKLAQSHYKKVDSIMDLFRQNIHNSSDKINNSEKYHKIYFGAMESFLIEYKTTKNPIILEKAFQFSEKGRAASLRQALLESEVRGFFDIPPEVISFEEKLAVDRAYLQSGLVKARSSKLQDTIGIEKIENQLFRINNRQDSLRKAFKEQYPKYHALKYKNEVIGLKELQKNLKPETTLLEYYYLDGLSYVFIISKDKSAVQKLNVGDLVNDIGTFQNSILNKETSMFKTKAYELYQKLIAPIADRLDGEELIIIPDGPLWNLNFDLLLSKEDTSNNPKDFSYVLRDFSIGYANSATAFFSAQNQESPTNNLECLAFSFSSEEVAPSESTMPLSVLRNSKVDLPGTRREISQIAKQLDGEYYYGAAANEENFKIHAPNYSLLHLALHGEVNDKKPNDSHLFFTNTKNSVEDNYLYAHELFALKLPAELVVLSACNTGTGKVTSGEGVMSLGNAFQYAGTRSLLLSQWEVSDNITPELMKYFYANLKKGMTKSRALQQTKLSYLATAKPNQSSPFYWGSFYVLGDNSSIELAKTNYFLWAVIILMAVAVLGWFFLRRNKTSNLVWTVKNLQKRNIFISGMVTFRHPKTLI